MKVTVMIEIDDQTGDYTLQILTSKKGAKIDQKNLSEVFRKICDNWSQKFLD
jgi:hypothetical protein